MTSETGDASTPRKGFLAGLLGGGKSYWVIALAAALAAIFGTLTILSDATATTTYYVLNQDVAARTQITPEMLTAKTVSVGGQPRNAIDVTDVQTGRYFARVPLKAGDVLSPSTVGPLERINAALPDGFVAASFQASPENAVAGKVRAGDYIDVIAVDDGGVAGGTAKVVLHRVLVLDVTVNPDNIAQAANAGQEGENLDPGPESNQVRGGIPSLYTVGLSPADAAKLALIRGKNLMIVLSANKTTGSLDASASTSEVFGSGPVGDSGKGTERAANAAQPGGGEDAAPPAATPNPGN